MTTYRFEEIAHPVVKSVPCRTCGKPVRRSTTFSQTVNPFNKDADGNPKTAELIRAELREQAEKWHPANDIHPKCMETADAPAEATS